MFRQKYQEKFIIPYINRTQNLSKRQEEIEKIEDEMKDIFYLFEELKNENIRQSETVTVLSDLLEQTKNEINSTENNITEAKVENDLYIYTKSIKSGLIGAGLGSLLFIYSPYIAIGTTVGGFITGYTLPYVSSYISSDKVES